MKHIVTIIVCCLFCVSTANATRVKSRPLSELVKEADHIIGGEIIKVDMIDREGLEVVDGNAKTGPRRGNTIRLHLKVDNNLILKTTKEITPDIIIVELWNMFHYKLRDMKEVHLNRNMIFLLKGDKYERVHPALFRLWMSEKEDIIRLLK